ncbi:MAG: TetR/AcrR family transcriptional regulator [Solirubrobacteraceae bacterium]|nr:TetR/AcrR family transcriptional regulator [Solirubrobacteraceae bacterium]
MTTTFERTARERILTALAEAVARDGYANAKIQEVARDAHVSLRTFYAEFTGKEQAFLELQQRALDGLANAVESTVTFQSPWRDEIRAGFNVYFRLLTARPRLTAAITHELVNLSPEAHAARQWARERFATMLTGLVDAGRAHYPEIPSRSLSPLLAYGVLGAILELVTSEMVDSSPEGIDELVEAGTDILWSIITNVD